MESKPWNIYWFSTGQKKEHLNPMPEMQYRDETSTDTERIKYNNNGVSIKKQFFAQSQEKAQLNPMEQQDSTTLLLKSSKSLLQMHETENYCKQTWEAKSEISRYWAICVLQFFVNHAVTLWNLKLTLIFLIKPLRCVAKKPRQKHKYLENKKSFWSEINNIFHHF